MPKLKLKVTHTHAGVAYPAGHVIDVDEHTAGWLIARNIAEHVQKPVPNRAAPASDAPDAPVKNLKTTKE